MLRNLTAGFAALITVQGLLYLFGGSLLGVTIGVIPGIGGIVILSLVLPFVYHISIAGTLAIFLAVHAASFYSASITSILLNTPAHPEAFAATFDGFPMAQRGEAGRALGISATATCVGGIVGCAVLVGLIQIMNDLPGVFHPPEYVALVMLALLLVGTLGTDKVSKAVVSAGIGIMLSAVGSDPVTGVFRYTFNQPALLSGFSLVALALGLFAVPQMVLLFGSATSIARQDMTGRQVTATTAIRLEWGFGRQALQGVGDAGRQWLAMIRGALIGSICGVIPGVGAFAANFLSYGVARQVSKQRDQFGTGITEGIVAPESSSIAKEAGGMVPVIGLGIPGGVGGALFLAALTIKGIRVGVGFTNLYPSLPYEIMWVIVLGGVIGTAIGLALSPLLARITVVPGPLLVPFIMVLASVGPFVGENAFYAVVEALCFCFIGFVMRRLRYSLAAFMIGLVLGPTLEQNIFLTHQVYPAWSFLAARPLADVLFAIVITVLVVQTLHLRSAARKANPPITGYDPARRNQAIAERFRLDHPYPLLAFMVSVILFAFSVAWVIYGLKEYSWDSALFPILGGTMVGSGSLWWICSDSGSYIRYLRMIRREQWVLSGTEQDVRAAEQGVVLSGRDPVAARRDITLSEPDIALSGQDLAEVRQDIAVSEPDVAVAEEAARSRSDRHVLPLIREKSWGWNGQYTRELCALGMYTALVAAMYLFGFLWSVPVFAALYGLFATRRVVPSLRNRIIYSVIAAGTLWGVTYELLNLLHPSFTPLLMI